MDEGLKEKLAPLEFNTTEPALFTKLQLAVFPPAVAFTIPSVVILKLLGRASVHSEGKSQDLQEVSPMEVTRNKRKYL